MRRYAYMLAVASFFLPAYAQNTNAALSICNQTVDTASVAIGYQANSRWVANGWWTLSPGECNVVYGGSASGSRFYLRATTAGPNRWIWGNRSNITFCTTSTRMNNYRDEPCTGTRAKFMDIGQFPAQDATYTLRNPQRNLPQIETGVIQNRCLFRWDDSHQVHSVNPVIRWNYQAFETTMKKLEHCIRIRVTGPINIENIAKQYVDHCVNYALNDNRVVHILSGIVGLGIDVLSAGTTAGSATASAVANYLYAVQDKAISCLTDTGRIQTYLQGVLRDKFNATVARESQWIFWRL
jgi:uncharacterized membrane protein